MAANQATTPKRPFSYRDVFGYFMGDFGCNMSFTLISSYMFIFYTQYIGISLEHYSIVILLSKILDGVNDPIIGAIVDRMGANKKGEKFKPWILRGAPILAASATIMFIDASAWTYAAKLVLCVGGYVLWDIMYTIVNVPYGALNSVMTTKPSERAALSNARAYGYVIAGVPLGVLIPMFAYNTIEIDGKQTSVFLGEKMFPIAVILGLVSIVAFAILYFNTEERVEHAEPTGEQEKFSYLQTIKAFFHNRAILGIAMASISQILFITGANQLHQLNYQMYYLDGGINSFQIITQLVPLFAGTVLSSLFINRFGKKELTSWPMLGAAAVYAVMYFVEFPNPFVWIGLQALGNTFAFGITIYTWAMVSDSIDYQEWKTGQRNEGSVYATYSMLRKVAQGLGQSFVPAAIAFMIPTLDVKDSITWTATNSLAIRDLSAIFPLIGYILIFVCMTFIYPLSKSKTLEMNIALGHEA